MLVKFTPTVRRKPAALRNDGPGPIHKITIGSTIHDHAMITRRATLAGLGLAFTITEARADKAVTLFAAASLKTALDALVAPLRTEHAIALRCVYAASSALARQIEQGAPADLFWSADREWMDWCVVRKLVRHDTLINLLGNTLVLIAPAQSSLTSIPLTSEALAKARGSGRIAIGETRSVPAGKYAKEALQHLNIWPELSAHLAETDNVRSALLLTARGETPLGIVYASDAIAEPRVKIIATFPSSSHKPIIYPLAMTQETRNAESLTVIRFMQSETARTIFATQGFSTLPLTAPA